MKKEEIKIGDKFFIYEMMDERVVEAIVYKFNRNEKGEIESYELASQVEDASFHCTIENEEYLFETFDDALNYALNAFKEDIIRNSERAKQKVEEEYY